MRPTTTTETTMYTAEQYDEMAELADDTAARIRSILDDLEGSGILAAGSYGVKLRSRLELSADRLTDCGKGFRGAAKTMRYKTIRRVPS